MKTRIFFLLDESGSMEEHKAKVLSGFQEYLNSVKDVKDAAFTLVKFDRHEGDPICRVVVEDQDIATVAPLKDDTFTPRGVTPLLDAVGQTIDRAKKKVEDGERALFIIFTDGLENASIEFKKESIKKLIEKLEKKGNWTFSYLGANQDAFVEGGGIGIAAGNIANYLGKKSTEAMRSVGLSTASYCASPAAQSKGFLADAQKEDWAKPSDA